MTAVATTWAMAVAWSPDDRYIAVAAYDGTCVLLDAVTGALNAVIPRDSTNARSVAFSPDGSQLAVGGQTLDLLPLAVMDMTPKQAMEYASRRWGLTVDSEGKIVTDTEWASPRASAGATHSW